MNYCEERLEYIEEKYGKNELKPMTYNFITSEDYLFERILYIRDVLANPDRYTDAPDKNALNIELYGLLSKYQEIVMKKVNLDEVED